MNITTSTSWLPRAGDTVSYRGLVCLVLAYDFVSDDLTIDHPSGVTITIQREDIYDHA